MNYNPGFHQQAGYQMMASYQCEYCSKLFVHKEAYDRHVLSHDVEKIVAGTQGVAGTHGVGQSPSDGTGASEPGPSTNRVKPQHKVTPVAKVPQCRPKVHACDECPKSYTRKDHLSRHKLWHIGDRPHVCSICFKSFIRKDKLIRHEKIHAKDTGCNCNICGKHFLRKDSLNKHLKTHEAQFEGKRKKTTSKSQQTEDVAAMDRIYSCQSKAQTMPIVNVRLGAQTL